MKNIFIIFYLAIFLSPVTNAKDIYSTLKFINNSDLSFDFSLFIKARPSGASGRAGYTNPAWLGKYSPDEMMNIPISFPHTPFSKDAYYWTDQSFFNGNDYIGFDLFLPTGRRMGLTNLTIHSCNFQGLDDGQTVIYNFEKNDTGYKLYVQMPSGDCSFSVTDGYGPRPKLHILKVENISVTDKGIDDGRKNAEQEIQKNPALLNHLDQVYFEATGINRANLRKKHIQQIGEQVKPFF